MILALKLVGLEGGEHMRNKIALILTALLLALTISAFAHENMDHSITTPTEHLIPAANPEYPVGTEVLLAANHMPGMQGAIARVSGAFETTLYAITYTRRDTGEVVKDHKWVIHEEITGHGEDPFSVGEIITLLPGHISGMGGEGVQAEITELSPGVAYMVDFSPVDGSEHITGHQWVSEEELLPYGALPGSPGCD